MPLVMPEGTSEQLRQRAGDDIPEGAAPLKDAEPDFEPDLAITTTNSYANANAIFDPAPYDTVKPQVDGIIADSIVVNFGGGVELAINGAESLAFFNSLRLGQDVTLTVTGLVADKGSPVRIDKDDNLTMVRKAKIAVHTLTIDPNDYI